MKSFFQLHKLKFHFPWKTLLLRGSRSPVSAYCTVWRQGVHHDDIESDEQADVDGGRLNYVCDGDGLADANGKGTFAATFNTLFLPSVLPPLRDDNDVTQKLAVSALSLRRWQLPVSAPMMDSAPMPHSLDSAPMPHSFLLDRYVNPLWSAASSSWATKLIYESISGASGQMGPFQSPSWFVSSQIRTTVIHVILLQAMERIKKRHKKENEIKLNTEAIKTFLSLCVNIVYLKLKILLSQQHKIVTCWVLQYRVFCHFLKLLFSY